MPENEHRKLVILIFKTKFKLDVARMLHPFVISILPSNKPYKQLVGRQKNLSIELINKVKSLLLEITPIITEKIIIKPPIDKVVLIAFDKASFRFSPKSFS